MPKMKVSKEYPEPHRKFVVMRGGLFFTATPCYGMHSPRWVVRTMGDYPDHEAPIVKMQPDDEWWTLEDFTAAQHVTELDRRCFP